MNKKSKNKKSSKPANPVPVSQKTEPEQKLEEDITAITEEKQVSLVKESDSVIEIASEITANEPVQDNKEMPTDTPKKPKRNKGKKKKQDEMSLEENKTASNLDTAPVPPPATDTEIKMKSDNMEINVQEEDKNTDENITASVRKKKNKKKQQEQQKIDETSLETHGVEQVKEESKKEEDTADKTKSDVTTQEIIEPDNKQTKKKNKKKKHRLDSEKSDKADEIVICTAAFKELISSTDNEGNINPETKVDLPEESGTSDKNLSASVEQETLKDLIQSVLLPQESNQSQDEALQSDRINESKSKKKTKKDKKQLQPKTDTEKNKSDEGQIEKPEPLVVSPTIEPEQTSTEQIECELKEAVPKVKAKIAKPVEKKRKGKAEPLEGHDSKLVEESVLGDLHVKETATELERNSQQTGVTDISTDLNVKKIEDTEKSEAIGLMTESEKSPETLISSDITCPPIKTPIPQSNLNLEDVNIGIKSSEAITKTSEVTHVTIDLKSDKNLENITSEPSTSLITPEKDNDVVVSPEPYKTVEKKKKKHPKKIDVSEKPHENKILVTPESESTKENTLQQNVDLSLPTLSPSADDSVEISSIKTDELVGSLDTTPDFIQHPLAASQVFVDDNNNMVIREITTTDEKLGLHLLIAAEPIIKDSDETPEPAGEKITKESPSIINIREKSLTNEPEKTDLKSKMMEVSQDMEELRLSIERSLAELTSMEKSEEAPVKVSENIEAPIPLLATPTEIKISDVIDDKTEKSLPLSENVLSETISQENKNKSEVLIEITEPNTQEDNLPKPENIQEQKIEMPGNPDTQSEEKQTPPQAPARKDNKGKGKGKRKGKQEAQSQQTSGASESTMVASDNTTKEVKKEEKGQQEQKSQSTESNENKGKQQQQAMQLDDFCNSSEQSSGNDPTSNVNELTFEPIENFEDALTSSVDDVNKTFEMIANEVNNTPELTFQNPEISISSPIEETERAEPKQNPVSPPKNLLGHPDIPVPSNRTDYKKEKNKPPNMRQAKVKIKDAVDIEKMEKTKQSRESQTENKRKVASNKNVLESFSYMTNGNAEYVYKYSFRKVFLQSLCHVCRKELGVRVPCQFCSLVFYCSQKHKDEDWPQHQSLCFAICTIAHLKDQKHIYANAKNITGQSYRLLRMQMIISCEKVLKRKLVPWEQEALLYPRMCADVACREWRQGKLADCEGCGQISYCVDHPTHLPASHQRWCRSYALYQRLVHHQQTRGRLEPSLPTGSLPDGFTIPDKINEVLAAIYDEKIDMKDTEYAALTQLATAPLTAAYGHQLATLNHSNGISKKPTFVIHLVGAELQFEADVLWKWERFFLHLRPLVQTLNLVLISPDLNPSNLPLELLEKVKLCESCRAAGRRLQFSFQDNRTYHQYWASDDFSAPDIVCAFNQSIQRSSMYNGKDTWPTAVSCVLKLKTPFIISSYSIEELSRDVSRVKECAELSGVSFKTITEPKINPFASVRPDRNFITDDEVPLLFKNYCFVVLCGV